METGYKTAPMCILRQKIYLLKRWIIEYFPQIQFATLYPVSYLSFISVLGAHHYLYPPRSSKGYPRRLSLQWRHCRSVVRRVHDPLGRDPERLVLRLKVISGGGDTAIPVNVLIILRLCQWPRGRAAPLHHLSLAPPCGGAT